MLRDASPSIRGSVARVNSRFVAAATGSTRTQGFEPATAGSAACLLDHFVGTQQQRLRDREPKSLRGPEVDHQLVSGGLLYGQISGLGALEDLVDAACAAAPEIREARPVRHETAGLHGQPVGVYGRQVALCREVCVPHSVETEYRVSYYEQCFHALFGHRRKGDVEIVGPSRLQDQKLHHLRPGGGLRLLMAGA
jgi:hypothetical protein